MLLRLSGNGVAHGANPVQVQRFLGHHLPAFTMATYVHLLDGQGAPALDLSVELPVEWRDAASPVDRQSVRYWAPCGVRTRPGGACFDESDGDELVPRPCSELRLGRCDVEHDCLGRRREGIRQEFHHLADLR